MLLALADVAFAMTKCSMLPRWVAGGGLSLGVVFFAKENFLKVFKDVLPVVLGVSFGIFSIALAYVVFLFCDALIYSVGFNWVLQKAEEAKLFDFALLVAICSFFGKEYLDSRRKRKEKVRKLAACKVLMAEELRLNYYAQSTLERIFKSAVDDEDVSLRPLLTYKLERGIDFFSVQESKYGSEGMMPIPKVHFKYYDRFVDVIAELDENLFSAMQEAYIEIRELEHVRVSLINNLQLGDNETRYIPKDIRDNGFVGYASNVVAVAYVPMNRFYILCAGKPLTESQLR